MLVKTIKESAVYDIGHAFGYYDYGQETGLPAAFSGQEATADYIRAYVRGILRGGFLHTTSERGEGYIAPISCRRKSSDSGRCGPLRWECCTLPP